MSDRLTRDQIENMRRLWKKNGRLIGGVNELCDLALTSLSLESVRSEALEEAARTAETEPIPGPEMPSIASRFTREQLVNAAVCVTIKNIAKRIRALSPARVAEQKDVHSTELRK